MRIRLVLSASLLASLLALCACGSGETESPPNVVLVILDTLRADALGSYGFSANSSAELDSIGRLGVRFHNAIAPCSWTRPSIGSMLTGRYPRTLGLYDEENERLPEDALTLAEILRAHGYRTIGATANPNINAVFGFDQGFDHYRDSERVFDWMPRLAGKKRASKEHRLIAARELYAEILRNLEADWSRPVYLQIDIMEIHPYGATLLPEYQRLYPEIEEPELRRYLQAVTQSSAELAAFMKSLTAKPGMADTLFIITSDHGQGLGSHPSIPNAQFHGYVLYESNVRVPWILHHEGGELPPTVIEQPVALLDLLPTVLDYLGLRVDAAFEGSSQMPMIREREATVEFIVTETRFREVEKLAVYTPTHKYIHNRDDWPGVRAHELQALGGREDGVRSDQAAALPGLVTELAEWLARWEWEHPENPPTPLQDGMSPELVEQLRAVGYLD